MKRIISLMLALVIAISAAVPAYATGDGNMDSGGSGMVVVFRGLVALVGRIGSERLEVDKACAR